MEEAQISEAGRNEEKQRNTYKMLCIMLSKDIIQIYSLIQKLLSLFVYREEDQYISSFKASKIKLFCNTKFNLIFHFIKKSLVSTFLINCYGTWSSVPPNNFVGTRKKSSFNIFVNILCILKIIKIQNKRYPKHC